MSRKIRMMVRPLNERELPDDLDDVVMGRTFLELAYSLNTEVGAGGWDQPAQLMLIRMVDRTLLGGAIGVAVEGWPVPGFAELSHRLMNQGGRMHHAILAVAEGWETLMKQSFFSKIRWDDVVGVALVHEGWMLLIDEEDERAADYKAAAAAKKVHQHKDRVETRLVNMADANGLRVGLQSPRDGVPMHLIGQARPGAHPSTYQLAGDVPNAIQYLAEIIAGRQPGEWKTWQERYEYVDVVGDEQ